MNELDFKNPNPETLSQIDSFFQNEEKFKFDWERAISCYYPRGGTDEGWKNVQKDYPEMFQRAWNTALWQMESWNVSKEQINNF